MVKRSTSGLIRSFHGRLSMPYIGYLVIIALLLVVFGSCKSAAEKPEAEGLDLGPAPTLTGANPVVPFPWVEYEAEDGIGGSVVGPGTAYYSVEAEASGRQYALLSSYGETVSWTATAAANSVVVRYTVPDTTAADADSASGVTGDPAPLEVLVNGTVVATLDLSSATSWIYGAFPWSNDPAKGNPHHYFDEEHALLPVTVNPGDTVALRNASSGYIGVDLMDLELVDGPGTMPEGAISLADYGPAADGETDDTVKLAQCIADAKAAGKEVWVPAGTYLIGSLNVSNVTVRGAGMWHTRFVGRYSRFNCVGGNLGFYDFAVLGETSTRDDNSGAENAFNGNPGDGSVLERIWVERKKCAFWVGEWRNSIPANNLAIRDCRFRDLMADAVNLCNGTSNSVIEGCFVRTPGDDGLACWSPANGGGLAENNRISGNVVQCPWLASGISIYGGKNITVENNAVYDTLYSGSGIYITSNFGAYPFEGEIVARNNVVVRCGANQSDMWGPVGAIRLLAWDADMTGAIFRISDCDVIDAVQQGITIQAKSGYTLTGVRISDIRVKNPGTYGINVRSSSKGEAAVGAVSVTDPGASAYVNSSPSFTVLDWGNNAGWAP